MISDLPCDSVTQFFISSLITFEIFRNRLGFAESGISFLCNAFLRRLQHSARSERLPCRSLTARQPQVPPRLFMLKPYGKERAFVVSQHQATPRCIPTWIESRRHHRRQANGAFWLTGNVSITCNALGSSISSSWCCWIWLEVVLCTTKQTSEHFIQRPIENCVRYGSRVLSIQDTDDSFLLVGNEMF
jgi:hypothetical protein